MSSLAFTNPDCQLYSLEELHAETVRLNLEPSRPTIRRVRRAIEIARSDAIAFQKHADAGRIYSVRSQTSDDCYTVIVPSVDLSVPVSDCSCTCPDAFRENNCKHAIAAIMLEEYECDLDNARLEQAMSDPDLRELMPSDVERFQTAWH